MFFKIWKWKNKEKQKHWGEKSPFIFMEKNLIRYFGKPKIKEEEMSPLSKV